MKNFLFYSLLFVFIGVTGCKKDDEDQCCDPANPECPNYDPCYGESEVSADFKFFARYGFGADAVWVEETKFVGSPVLFSANDKDADAYTWYLGLDTFTGVTEVERSINQLPDGTYPAALVIEKSPNTQCFPFDDGRDSIHLNFEVVDRCDALPFGVFRGKRMGVDSDSIDIEIYLADYDTGEPCVPTSTGYFVNCAGQNDTVAGDPGIGTYSRWNYWGSGFGSPRGEMIVHPDWTVEFDYEYYNVNYSFKGRKIQ